MDEELRKALTDLTKDVGSRLKPGTKDRKFDFSDRSKAIANWVAAIAIPLVLGLSGYFVNHTLKTKESQTKMVELAISMLSRQPQGSQEDKQLRGWAVDVIQRFSGVTIPPDARKSLEESQILLGNANVGTTRTQLNTRSEALYHGETAFGNLVADAIREAFKADVAIVNSGSIRGNRVYEPGTVLTRFDLFGEMPFHNTLVLLSITGDQLIEVLEYGLNSKYRVAFPQVSGIRFSYRQKVDQQKRVFGLTIKGKPVDPNTSYTLATIDFMAGGGDGYTNLTKLKPVKHSSNGRHLADVLMLYVYARGEVSPKIEGRIVATDAPTLFK
jgi:hypothetical protein